MKLIVTHTLPDKLKVRVTHRDIIDGDGRSCTSCALALAINRALPGDWLCYVSPYAAFVEAVGIKFNRRWRPAEFVLPIRELPSGLIEWARDFDEWKECRLVGVREWREDNGKEPDERPLRPSPWSFELDLTRAVEMKS